MIWNAGILYAPGRPIKGDRMVGKLRVWPPERSKLAALCYLKGCPMIHSSYQVLYLGAAAGTTVSFLADYVDIIYAVEMAPEPLPQLLDVCRIKKNIIPIPVDGSTPEVYAPLVSPVNMIYQDIAQKNQVEILVKNLQLLKSGGLVILMLKIRSVSSHGDALSICDSAVRKLEISGVNSVAITWLEEYHRGHVALVGYKS